MLRDIQGCEVEPERAHAPHEAAHQEIAGVPAAIGREAVGGELDVRKQLVRALIGVGPSVVGGLETFADLAEKNAVRLPIVTCGHQFLGSRKQARICIDAARERCTDFYPVGALAQCFRKLAALVEIRRHDQLLMAVQRLANGLAVHVAVAVHVAADPGSEMQNTGYVERLHGNRVFFGECCLDFFVKERDDAVQNLYQVKEHVLTLVGDGESFSGMVFGLPYTRDLQPHPRPHRFDFRVGQGWIEPFEQILRDVLLLA